MTAAAMAGELKLPLFSVLLDGLLTSSWARPHRSCARSSPPWSKPAGSISSTSSTRSALGAASAKMLAKSAACSIPSSSSWRRTTAKAWYAPGRTRKCRDRWSSGRRCGAQGGGAPV